MAESPQVSVVMPVLHPHPQFFPEAVRSILGQTFQDWELIIVEEPSDGPRVADLLADVQDPRIRILTHSQRTSLVQQLNRGLEAALGPLIARMDADDVAEPDRLQKQAESLNARPEVTVIGSQVTIIDEWGNCVAKRRYPTDHEAILTQLRRSNPLAHPAVMCRREAVLAVGGYCYEDYPAVEDYDLWCRMAQRGYRFANHPEALLRYRLHGSALKATKLRGLLRGTLAIKRRYFAGQGNIGDYLRYAAEIALLGLPPSWVYGLFRRWTLEPVKTR
ncbi:MAG: glycosyltransferase [Gemmatales bacterium]|nr:glycosyltransferase [Gemmatales bacterium]MDW8387886.1 glycosyltransferase [Gemmatales bacterium]